MNSIQFDIFVCFCVFSETAHVHLFKLIYKNSFYLFFVSFNFQSQITSIVVNLFDFYEHMVHVCMNQQQPSEPIFLFDCC